MNVGVNSLVCDYSVHAVSSKCLDQILFINKDHVFNVMKGFWELYQTQLTEQGRI